MSNIQKIINLPSLDEILNNLKIDKNYYNKKKQEEFSRFDRDD